MSEPRDTTPQPPDAAPAPEPDASPAAPQRRYSRQYEALVRSLGLKFMNTALQNLTPRLIAAAFRDHAVRLRELEGTDTAGSPQTYKGGLLRAVQETDGVADRLLALADAGGIELPPMPAPLVDEYVDQLLGAEKDTLAEPPAWQGESTPSLADIRKRVLALSVPTPDGSLIVHRVYGYPDTWAIVHSMSGKCWDREVRRWTAFSPHVTPRDAGVLYRPLSEAWAAALRLPGELRSDRT
ncbi:hypothetical protein ACWDO7_22795 [Streptomyces sp. NPDC003656]